MIKGCKRVFNNFVDIYNFKVHPILVKTKTKKERILEKICNSHLYFGLDANWNARRGTRDIISALKEAYDAGRESVKKS